MKNYLLFVNGKSWLDDYFVKAFSDYIGKPSSKACSDTSVTLLNYLKDIPDGNEIKITLGKSIWTAPTERITERIKAIIAKDKAIADYKLEIDKANTALDLEPVYKVVNPPETTKGRKAVERVIPDNLFVKAK